MSRQDVGRAALRLLTSHEEEDESHRQHKAQQQHHEHSHSQEKEHQQTSSSASIASSYFGGNALQITDSPTTSPVLSASTFHRYDTYPRSIGQRRRVARLESGNTSTPGTNDVPSLSLSNSSFSDGPLRSPFSEHAPSQTSVSSTRTLMQQPSVGSFDQDRQQKMVPEATLRRVASNLQMPIEDVRKVQRCMSLDLDVSRSQEEDVVDKLGRERYNQIVQAFRSEEEQRSSRLPSFQSSYLRTETLPVESNAHQYRQQYSSGPPQLPARSTPLSPSGSSHDDLDFLDRSGPIPSPRAALELLAAGNSHHAQPHSPISPTTGFEPYSSRIYPSNRQAQYWGSAVRSPYHRHSRQTSGGARPISLPDRSYHSMDDYTPHGVPTAPPLLRGDSSLSVRQSMQKFVSSPTQQQFSRPASRSPLIDSPAPLEDDDMETVEPEESLTVRSASRSPSHLRPGAFSSRQRCASSYENDGFDNQTKASRRASAEVLGHAIKRTTSPLVVRENMSNGAGITASSSQPISHEEVMARLQRKVKERLAARGAGQDLSSSNVIVGGRSSSQKAMRSPNMSKHTSLPYGTNPGSIGRSGRKRQDSLGVQGAPPSATRRGANAGGQSKPRKSNSLRGLPREMEGKSLVVENEGDAKMEDLYDNSGTAGMGIEALLSAAAIADNPRRGL